MDNNFTAVMVDLETMSLANNAAIASIGAVKFWLNVNQETFSADQLFHVTVDLASCQEAGLHIDAETVKWWLKQEKDAQQALLRGVDLKAALNAFLRWYPDGAVLFGNGATFDNIILRSAFKAVNVGYPVTYKNDLCYRTMTRMSDVGPLPFEGTKHNALDDAKAQTRHLMAILQKTPWHGK